MEKRPTYDLDRIKVLISDPATCIITKTGRNDAVTLGYVTEEDIVGRVHALRPSELYKTMESDNMPGLWQDVYRTDDPNGNRLYIKLQEARDKGIIVSFKKR